MRKSDKLCSAALGALAMVLVGRTTLDDDPIGKTWPAIVGEASVRYSGAELFVADLVHAAKIMDGNLGSEKSWLRGLVREPLVHFAALGAVIYIAASLWEPAPAQYTIAIDANHVQRLKDTYGRQYGVAPTPEQLRILIDQYVRDEILFREGMALGLDRDDEIVRRRIAQKYEFIIEDREVLKQPDDAAISAFYAENQARYTRPLTASFSHVFFTADNPKSHMRADATLKRLQASGQTRAPDIGDRFSDLYDYAGIDRSAVDRLFGTSAFSAAVFESELGMWAGPFRSGYGWHLIYITGRDQPRVVPLAEIRDQVVKDYEQNLRESANVRQFAELRKKYTVVRADQPRD